MRYYSYVEPTGDDINITKVVYSELEILDQFWDYWQAQMKGNGFGDLINKETCIEDWCTIHWAQREDVYKFKSGFENKAFCIDSFHPQDPNFNWAKIVCLNDNSVVIDKYVNLETEMIKVDGITEQNNIALW